MADNGKDEWIQKLRVEASRKRKYERAYARRRKADPELTFSDWMRAALDRQSNEDLEAVAS